MAQQNTANLGGGAGGSIREDLANFVSNIDRDETPLSSMSGSTKATSTYHDWLTDEYATPIAQTVAEGAAFGVVGTSGTSLAAGTLSEQMNRTRLRNFTQIFRSQVEVSNTAIAVNTAGIANEFAYQLKKKGVEVRRNREFQFVLYGANSVKNETGSVRRLGSLVSWVGGAGTTESPFNIINAATAGSPSTTYSNPGTGDGRPVFTGTAAAFARSQVERLITIMYRNGGKPNMLMTSASQRTGVSNAFNSDTTTGPASNTSIRRLESMEKKLNISIAAVVTDFGVDLGIVPNYIMDLASANSVMYMFDSSMVKSAMLRPLSVGKLDDRGDGKQALITEECTLEVMNPNSVGVIGNLTVPA